jgi:isopenicillin N synthase-like dioxygenase
MGDEEFEQLVAFFSLPQEEKMKRFSEVLQHTVSFFKAFRETMEKGTPDEKADMLRKAIDLQNVMKEETQGLAETVGLSENDLKDFALNAANFTPEQWEEMQRARGELDKQVDAISETLSQAEESLPKPPSQKPKPKRQPPSRDNWMKS